MPLSFFGSFLYNCLSPLDRGLAEAIALVAPTQAIAIEVASFNPPSATVDGFGSHNGKEQPLT